jgi:Na+-transporting methylmalonyl-CoA/oxaloacetate decarboxylase gamma subunit
MGIVIAFLIALVCLISGVFLWIKLYNSEDGERYRKQRMQGPFVPEPKSDKSEKDTYTNTK